MAPEAQTRFEIRCPEARHLLAQVRVPQKFLAAGKPAIYSSVYCPKCRVWCEHTYAEAAPEPPATPKRWDPTTYRRQRRVEFQARSPKGRHLLGRMSIPTAFLKPGEPPIAFYTVCNATKEKVEVVFGAFTVGEADPPEPASTGRAVECANTR